MLLVCVEDDVCVVGSAWLGCVGGVEVAVWADSGLCELAVDPIFAGAALWKPAVRPIWEDEALWVAPANIFCRFIAKLAPVEPCGFWEVEVGAPELRFGC